ncbi:unnamed protein product [Arabidopsis lyrata]|nr:unnamed protein product [Arabidopsis lyrata]
MLSSRNGMTEPLPRALGVTDYHMNHGVLFDRICFVDKVMSRLKITRPQCSAMAA